MSETYKLGSMFDGSGGFPLAGSMCGITPAWASEVEPYPIAVTRSRFPGMKHLGDISKINGAEIEPVNIITFGSPCQDLSVAGKRAGIKHEATGDEETTRSGLFMEAVRIIKEMRRATNGVYPNVVLWENVPGAFSSNGGEDFRTVLQELIQIVEPDTVMPPVPKAGWAYADSYSGDGWSLAYRVFDAQYWGVPQRRRRIHLVLHLTGQCARKILFERQGLRGYFAEGRTPWKTTSGDAEAGSGAADCQGKGHGINGEIAATLDGSYYKGCGMRQGIEREVVAIPMPYTLKIRSGCEGGGKGALVQEGKSATLRAAMGDNQFAVAYGFPLGFRPENVRVYEETATTLVNGTRPGFTTAVICMATQQGGAEVRTDDKAPTVTAAAGMSGNNQPVVCYPKAAAIGFDTYNQSVTGDKAKPMTAAASDADHVPCVCIPIHDQATRFSGKRGDKSDGKGNGLGVGNPGDPMNTLTSGDRHAVCYAMLAFGKYAESEIGNNMKARDYKDATDLVVECAGIDCRNMNEYPELFPTLQAKPNGRQSLNFSGAVRIRYIVRRLTPTECQRLQGFADAWGIPYHKDDFTDEEYRFWLEVRNTHAAINGKAVKEYTKEQILKWYNGLHTDSSEYKMWGNGIALPPALYCMQGIVDALEEVGA